MEATYEMQRKGKGKEVQKERDEPRVRSLVELMALEVGWGIEDAVQSCMEGVQEDREPRRRSGMGDLNEDEEEGDGDSSLESIRVKGSLEEGQEDGNLLADEWYESCPDYCSRWIFGQHAASVLLDGLQDGPFALVEALYEHCVTHGASNEATRFYDLLNHLGFASSSKRTSHSISVHSAPLAQTKAYFASLEATLLASSFSQRLFYSDFISLTHAQLEPGEEPLVAGLCEVVCDVAGEMLASIAEAAKGGERGGDRLMEDVATRVEREVGFAVPYLLEQPRQRSAEKLEALERVSAAVFDLATLLSDSPTEHSLSPISLLFEFELLARDLESTNPAALLPSSPHFARLIHLNSLATSSATPFAAHLTHFTASRTSYTLSTVSATLASLSLHAIDALLLGHTLEAYHTLPDVKATQGRGVLEKSAFFERLKDAEGKSLEAGPQGASTISSDAIEGSEKTWRFEEMVSGYVPVTPALLRTARGGGGETEGIEDSPLGSASLSRRMGGSAGREGSRTPMKTMLALRGRLRPRVNKSAERRSGRVRRQETTTSDLEDADDDDEEEEEEEEVTPGRSIRRTARPIQMLDLSMDASDSDTATSRASDGDVLVLDSDGASSTAASEQEHDSDDPQESHDASTSHLRYEILDTLPSPFPTSEVDDLDLLSGRNRITMVRKRSGSESTIRGGASPRKRQAPLVRFEVEDSEESADELGL